MKVLVKFTYWDGNKVEDVECSKEANLPHRPIIGDIISVGGIELEVVRVVMPEEEYGTWKVTASLDEVASKTQKEWEAIGWAVKEEEEVKDPEEEVVLQVTDGDGGDHPGFRE